jgi:hypothetical protein
MEYRDSEQQSELSDETLVAWLPEDIRADILTIIRAGRRIPEEILGPIEMLHIWEKEAE